jgi:hypothetical protein
LRGKRRGPTSGERDRHRAPRCGPLFEMEHQLAAKAVAAQVSGRTMISSTQDTRPLAYSDWLMMRLGCKCAKHFVKRSVPRKPRSPPEPHAAVGGAEVYLCAGVAWAFVGSNSLSGSPESIFLCATMPQVRSAGTVEGLGCSPVSTRQHLSDNLEGPEMKSPQTVAAAGSIGRRRQPSAASKRWPSGTLGEVLTHLAGSNLGSAVPPALHSRPRRATAFRFAYRFSSQQSEARSTGPPGAAHGLCACGSLRAFRKVGSHLVR